MFIFCTLFIFARIDKYRKLFYNLSFPPVLEIISINDLHFQIIIQFLFFFQVIVLQDSTLSNNPTAIFPVKSYSFFSILEN